MSSQSPPDGRILITGANGHLGRRLILRSGRDGGPAVRAVVRSERAAATLREMPDHAPEDVVILDYTDEEALASAAQGCRAAVHLVGIIKETRTSRFADAHEASTATLATAARRADLERVVYLSILGSRPDSANPCLASKGRAEEILAGGDVPSLTLRVPMVIGENDFVSRKLAADARAKVVLLLRGGRGKEQPIDAEDVVSAVLAAVDFPGDEHRSLDLAGPESLTRRALLERCALRFGNRPTVVPVPRALMTGFASLAERLPDPPLSRAMLGVLDHDDDIDPTPACRVLGIALTPLDETLARCVGGDDT